MDRRTDRRTDRALYRGGRTHPKRWMTSFDNDCDSVKNMVVSSKRWLVALYHFSYADCHHDKLPIHKCSRFYCQHYHQYNHFLPAVLLQPPRQPSMCHCHRHHQHIAIVSTIGVTTDSTATMTAADYTVTAATVNSTITTTLWPLDFCHDHITTPATNTTTTTPLLPPMFRHHHSASFSTTGATIDSTSITTNMLLLPPLSPLLLTTPSILPLSIPPSALHCGHYTSATTKLPLSIQPPPSC